MAESTHEAMLRIIGWERVIDGWYHEEWGLNSFPFYSVDDMLTYLHNTYVKPIHYGEGAFEVKTNGTLMISMGYNMGTGKPSYVVSLYCNNQHHRGYSKETLMQALEKLMLRMDEIERRLGTS